VVNEPFELQDLDLERYVGQSASEQPRCVCIEGSQVDRMTAPLAKMRKAGWRIAIQSTGLPASWRTPQQLKRLLEDYDVVFINREVARDATDCRGGEKQLIDAMVALVNSVKARAIVVFTIGDRGALVIPPGETPILMPAKTVEVVDLTGNGSALAGAFLSAWLHTGDVLLAADWGTAAGSFITSVPGSLGTVPSAADLQELVGNDHLERTTAE
jgi:ribokinase